MFTGAQVVRRPAGARFEVLKQGDWTVVTVAGEVDLTVTDLLDAHLAAAIRQADPMRVAVDLGDMVFCDSSGLNSLIRALKRIRAEGGRLVLLRPRARFAQVLETTGLKRVFEVSSALPS